MCACVCLCVRKYYNMLMAQFVVPIVVTFNFFPATDFLYLQGTGSIKRHEHVSRYYYLTNGLTLYVLITYVCVI